MAISIPVYNLMIYRPGGAGFSDAPADGDANLLRGTYAGGTTANWSQSPLDAEGTPNWATFDAFLETLDPTIPFFPDLETWGANSCETTQSDLAIRERNRSWIATFFEKLVARHPGFGCKKDGSSVGTGMYGFPGGYPVGDTAAAKALWRTRQLEMGLSTGPSYPRGLWTNVSTIQPSLYITSSNRTNQTETILETIKAAREGGGGRPVWGYFHPRYHPVSYTDASLRQHFLRKDDFSYYFQLVAEHCDAIALWDWDGYGDSENNTWQNYPATTGDPAAAYNSSYPAKWNYTANLTEPEDNWEWLVVLKQLMGAV